MDVTPAHINPICRDIIVSSCRRLFSIVFLRSCDFFIRPSIDNTLTNQLTNGQSEMVPTVYLAPLARKEELVFTHSKLNWWSNNGVSEKFKRVDIKLDLKACSGPCCPILHERLQLMSTAPNLHGYLRIATLGIHDH